MIVVTGSAGFIGSCLTSYLIRRDAGPIVAVDDFSPPAKKPNWSRHKRLVTIDRNLFFTWLERTRPEVDFVFHLGARTDTTISGKAIFNELNLDFSKKVWEYCSREGVPLIYASSAATYGDGALGYSDDHSLVPDLKPLNDYGRSKQDFDNWALDRTDLHPPAWYGLKFFNVYGPNEYHKGRMSSMVFHAFHQIRKNGSVRLFRSHRSDIPDGHQKRDFIWIMDIMKVVEFLYLHRPDSGIYNVGTGEARTFLDLTHSVFSALNKEAAIGFIDTPKDIRDNYQYYTAADINKLRKAGFPTPFTTLETGIKTYVREYLKDTVYY